MTRSWRHHNAEAIGRFDLVALTEVRRDSSDLLPVMELLPQFWDVVASDYGSDRAANKERVAYVFDKRVARFTGLAAECCGTEIRWISKHGGCGGVRDLFPAMTASPGFQRNCAPTPAG